MWLLSGVLALGKAPCPCTKSISGGAAQDLRHEQRLATLSLLCLCLTIFAKMY